MSEEFCDMSSFRIPKCASFCSSLSTICLSSSLTYTGYLKNGDLSITCKSTSVFRHVSVSSLRLNVPLYLFNKSCTSSCSSFEKHDWCSAIVIFMLCLFVIFSWLTWFFLQLIPEVVVFLKDCILWFKMIVLTQFIVRLLVEFHNLRILYWILLLLCWGLRLWPHFVSFILLGILCSFKNFAFIVMNVLKPTNIIMPDPERSSNKVLLLSKISSPLV